MKISVIIPCYNVEKYIHTCMESLINQTYGLTNLEIILVDDKSTDNTAEILKQYEKLYPENVLLILCEKNGRQGTARNIGLSYASGDYISFVDSDDWIRKDMYEILTNIISETNCDIVQFESYPAKDTVPDAPLTDLSYKCYDFSNPEQRRKYILRSDIYNESCWRKIYKHELLRTANVAYAEGVSYEEPLFTYPLKFFVNKVCTINAPLYYYRYNDNGTTVTHMSNVSTILQHLEVQQLTYNFMKERTPFYNTYKNEIDLYFLHAFYVEPFYFLRYRGIVLPSKLFLYMCQEIKRQLPDYKNNPYLKDNSLAEECTLINLIEELQNADTDTIDKRIKEAVISLTE